MSIATRIARARLLPLALGVWGLVTTTTLIAQESFRATHATTLTAEAETGGVEDPVAFGVAIFRVDRATNTIAYRVSVGGLDSIIAAHIHRGPAGQDGPPVISLAITDAMHTAAGTASGLSATFIDSLLAGNAYVNVHTRRHPGGHIRGQILELPNASALQMTTSQEPHQVFSDSGTGSAALFIDEASMTARYTVGWSALTGRATMAHFHMGAPGQAGPPVHTIAIPADSTVTVSSGTWQMTAEQLVALKSGLIYANVHTAINPQGEIRGIVLPVDFYTAAVSAANEVPSHADSSQATGTAIAFAVRSPVGGLVFVNSVVEHTVQPISGAHIHRGAIGVNGPVVVPLTAGMFPGAWTATAATISTDDLGVLANTGMYVNYHTQQWPLGEARGQLIAAELNLSAAVSSAPIDDVERSTLRAVHERGSDVIAFRLPAQAPAEGTIELHSAIGARVASVAVDGPTARIATTGLPAGAYFARLVSGARVVATARVIVTE